MKFKDGAIKRNTIIHCPTRDDAIALQKRLEEIGFKYVGWMANNYCHFGENTCYYIKKDGMLEHQSVEFYVKANCGDRIVEFSDLIEPDEPQMSAVEVLEWLKHTADIEIGHVFYNNSFVENGGIVSLGSVIARHSAEEIIQKITAHEAAKKEKHVEVKGGYACSVYDENNCYIDYIMWGVDEDTAKDDVIDRAIKLAKETGKQVCTAVHFVCRVKGGSDE